MAKLTITGPRTGWQKAYSGDLHIGGFGETTRECPSMRWYWTGQGTFGHCETRDEAIAALEALVPAAIKAAGAVRAEQAAFDALPAHLQVLKCDLDAAYFEQQRAWGRQPFNEADYISASDRWSAARIAFDKAHDAWASQREAA